MKRLRIGLLSAFSTLVLMILVLTVLVLAVPAQAQILMVNEGETVRVRGDVVVTVQGGLWNRPVTAPDGAVLSNGLFYNSSDSVFVRGDVINDDPDSMFVVQPPTGPEIEHGAVNLNGTDQAIAGTVPITFQTLRLQGPSGTKTLEIDSYADDTLHFGDRELDCAVFTFHVRNPISDAVKRFETGFASADPTGWLLRHVAAGSDFLFPVGDSVSTLRYRPASVTPTQSGTFAVRFANYNATTDGRDIDLHEPTICRVNPDFHHLVRGAQTADVDLYYDEAADPIHYLAANWDGSLWTDEGNAASPAQVPGFPGQTLDGRRVSAWAWVPAVQTVEAFALAHPQPTVTLGPLPPRLCTNDSAFALTITATPTDLEATVQYLIVARDGTVTPLPGNLLNPALFPGDLIYEVVVVYTYPVPGQPGEACEARDTAQLRIDQALTAGYEVLRGDLDFCQGQESVTLIARPSGAQYQWIVNGEDFSTEAEIVLFDSALVSLIVTNPTNACPDTLNETIRIRAFRSPTVVLTNTLPTEICANVAGFALEYTTGDTYGPDGIPSTDTTFTVIFPNGQRQPLPNGFFSPEDWPAGQTYGLEVRVTNFHEDGNECFRADTLTLELKAPPAVTATADGPTTFCDNDPVTLTASPLGSDYTYQWLRDGEPFSTAPRIQVNQSGSYELIVVDRNTGCRDTTDSPLTIVAVPVADFTVTVDPPAPYCEAASVTLTAVPEDPDAPAYAYEWFHLLPNGGEEPAGTGPELTVIQSGTYYVLVTVSGQPIDCPVRSLLHTIVFPEPLQPEVQVTGDLAGCQGEQVRLRIANFRPGYTFQWYRDGQPIEGGITLTVTEDGDYSVVFTEQTCSLRAESVVFPIRFGIVPQAAVTHTPEPAIVGTAVEFESLSVLDTSQTVVHYSTLR